MENCRRGLTVVLIVAAVVLSPFALVVLYFMMRVLSFIGEPTAVTPEQQAIVGTWTGDHGARMVFKDDGTCQVASMPVVPDDTGMDQLPNVGSCKWWVVPLGNDAGYTGGIAIDTGGAPGRQLFFNTTGNAGHPALFVTIGDPDNGDLFRFSKKVG